MRIDFFKEKHKEKGFGFILILIFLLITFLSLSKRQEEPDAVSHASTQAEGLYNPVLDNAGVFTQESKRRLESFISQLDTQAGVQIAVITEKTIGEEDIESFSLRHAEKYKLGQKGTDNGVLITVVTEQKNVRIETGYGAEGILTDAACSRIIRNTIIPLFKQERYAEGIESGVKAIAEVFTGEETAQPAIAQQNSEEKEEVKPGSFVPLLFIALIIFFMLKRRNGLWLLYLILGSRWNGDHKNNHNDFKRGGGGTFGGGGASGKW
ncbi:TPM domain-containing protein [Treponema sp.]|uniref:TPM domain-containing protein n=1 Tax=Treponema sp. TaxID=166 RepID=UPI003F0D035D